MYLPWESWGCKHSDHFYRAYFSPRSTLRRLLQLNWAIPWSWNPFPCLGYIYFLFHSVTSPVPLYIMASWIMFSLGPGERIFFLPHTHMLLSHVHKDVWKDVHTHALTQRLFCVYCCLFHLLMPMLLNISYFLYQKGRQAWCLASICTSMSTLKLCMPWELLKFVW